MRRPRYYHYHSFSDGKEDIGLYSASAHDLKVKQEVGKRS
jgi:hypothetical protein